MVSFVARRTEFSPFRGISALVGKFANLQLPKYLLIPILKIYISLYKINTKDILKEDLKEYKTINEFFIRELKEGVRTIDDKDDSHSVCSP